MFSLVEIIGYLGGITLMISFLPQVLKSYKTKSVEDLSMNMIFFTFISTVFWLIYGYMIGSWPIMATNGVFGLTVIFQAYLKFKYGKK